MELAHLGLSTIQKQLSSLDRTLKMTEELRSEVERLSQLLRHEKGWRFPLRQYTLRSIDYLFFPPEEWIKRRVQETNKKSNMMRSWYRDNIIWDFTTPKRSSDAITTTSHTIEILLPFATASPPNLLRSLPQLKNFPLQPSNREVYRRQRTLTWRKERSQ